LQISGGDAVNPLVAFYDIRGRMREIFFLSRTQHATNTVIQFL
jgi:hypothetical protein